MSVLPVEPTERERELGAIIGAYNEVTDRLKESHERLTGEVGLLREELARKNQQLRRRERLAALGEMAAGLAHEIRNPLGGIRVFASLLEDDLEAQPESCRMVSKIIKGVGQLESIVNNVLEFGRPAKPHVVRAKLGPLVTEAVELVSAEMKERAINFEVDPQLQEVELSTDAAMIQRALMNLIRNAGEALTDDQAQTSPKVRVFLVQESVERVTVAVEDNGPGICREDMDRIFNPFHTGKVKGTGLGLAIVHQIAEVLGGNIKAANQNTGGARFTLTVPKVYQPSEDDESMLKQAMG